MDAFSPLIFVVDDEPALLHLLEVRLRQEGFNVVTAASGAEALEAYRRHGAAVAVVLLDVRMPEMDGLQTLAALRQIDPTVCCYLTGGDPRRLEGALVLGAAGSFTKPFRLDDLARQLWEAARRRGQQALGDAGLLVGRDHRVAVRHPCDRRASARHDPGTGVADLTASGATVRNLSATGVGLLLDRAFPPDTMLLVESWQRGSITPTLLVRVIHAGPQGAGWYHGCELCRRLTEDELQDWLA